jgi:hypothetical protein
MANNPPVQRWFMEGAALAPLLALLADHHPVVATKAVLGLSALVRHYDPALEVGGAPTSRAGQSSKQRNFVVQWKHCHFAAVLHCQSRLWCIGSTMIVM